MYRTTRLAVLALACTFLASHSAQADAIDGIWCDTKGNAFEIRGNSITTPGGRQLSGAYTRHTFVYVAPEGERASGRTINMALVDDETLHLLIEQDGGNIEVWRRCTDRVS